MAAEFVQDYETFGLGDFTLQHGDTLRDATLAYKTFGELNADRSNAIVYPTWYSGFHWDNEWLIGEDMALDPRRYFIIVPNMLGNGLSSSPSNTPPPHDRANFPKVTFHDQVEAQHRERIREPLSQHNDIDVKPPLGAPLGQHLGKERHVGGHWPRLQQV